MKQEDSLLTQGEISGVIRRYLKKFPYHKDYPLRTLVAKAQLDKLILLGWVQLDEDQSLPECDKDL